MIAILRVAVNEKFVNTLSLVRNIFLLVFLRYFQVFSKNKIKKILCDKIKIFI